ncbi:MAG: hypothetical protein QNJ36_03740 [Calothrix sp. MO_167.B42]|nr:hypothetical protein [Calothrix sp. MO_167.B42]
MNKQQFAFKFGFAVILFTSLLGAPIRANAGGTNDFPGRPDGFPGRPDVFPGQGGRPPRIAPPLRGKVRFTTNADGKVQITVTPAVQENINQKAATMRTNPQVVANRQITTRNEKTIVFRVMAVEDNPTNAQTELTKSLSESGLSANTIETLTEKIIALLVAKSSNVDGNRLVDVDVNQLNEAINSYNKIVTNSKGSVIRKLARNRDFREIRERLVELASGLN